MKYDHRVKVDGIWFDAGVEVTTTPDKDTPSVDTPKTEDTPSVSTDEKKYTRTQIQQMNKASLTEVAKELGIEFDDETTGNEFKSKILAKLGI